MSAEPLRLGVLISGAGSTLANLIECIADGRIPNTRIAVVISSRADVRGVAIAREAGLAVEIVRRAAFADMASFSEAIAGVLDAANVELAVQAGWLCYWRLPAAWLGRVINIHPSLLPEFGGKGFYGHHVHDAVLAAGRARSGATVHYVDNEYDHGEIIAQRDCAVEAGDTAESLAARVGVIERQILPEVIARLAASKR